MNKKGITISNLGYTGIVTLSQYTDGKKFKIAEIHNKGGKALFNFIVECLAGNYEAADRDIPLQILLLNIDDDDNIDSAIGNSFITISTIPEKVYSETEGIIRYSFILPSEYFTGTNFNAIGLYPRSATSAQNFAAYCKVDTSEWAVSPSSVLVLDWELHISNT